MGSHNRSRILMIILLGSILLNGTACFKSEPRIGSIIPVHSLISWQLVSEKSGEINKSPIGPFRIIEKIYTDKSDSIHSVLLHKKYTEPDVSVYSFENTSGMSFQARDFCGLKISGLPLYDTGICSYIVPRSQFAYPQIISSLDSVAVDQAVFFMWKYNNGLYGAAIPMGGDGFRGVLQIKNGNLSVNSQAFVDNISPHTIPLLTIGFSKNPYQLVSDVMTIAVKEMGLEGTLRKEKTFPQIFKRFGWCSWNALGRDGGAWGERITASDLYDFANSFNQSFYAVPWMLVDDGWQILDQSGRRMSGFDANQTKFPDGLEGTVSTLKNLYHVPYVGLWHTVTGYWEGVSPNSFLETTYRDVLMDNNGYLFPTPLSAKGTVFYRDWYSHLKKCGVDFLKVDNQGAIIDHLKSAVPLWSGAAQMQENMQSQIQQFFNGTVINCMALKPEVYFHWQKSAIARSSYDYLSFHETGPKGPFEVYIRTNFQNSLWLSQLVWPDFDMFQSHKPHSMADAVARIMSGGPVYSTDELDKQNWDVLGRLQLSDGTLLRPDYPARPTLDCLFQSSEPKPYKVFSAAGDVGLLAAWNLSSVDSVQGSFKPNEIEGLEGENIIVFEHFSRQYDIIKLDDAVDIVLGKYGCKLYVVAPIESGVQALGLVDKFVSPAAILGIEKIDDSYKVELIHGGDFAMYSAKSPSKVVVNGKQVRPADFVYQDFLLLLEIPGRENVSVEIQYN